MAAPMTANFAAAADPQPPAEPYPQQQPYLQQQQQQQQQQQYQQQQQQYQQQESHPPPPPTRQTSFGLPSIPRTTSFGWGSKKSATEEDRGLPSPIGPLNHKSQPQPPSTESDTSGEEAAFGPDSRGASPVNNFAQPPSGQQQPYYGHISAQAPPSSQPPASMSHHIAGQMAPNSQPMNGFGAGPSQQAANGFAGSASDANRSSPRIPSSSQQPPMGRGSPLLNQPGQMPRQTSPAMPGQAFMPSLRPGGVAPGNPVNQLPPSPRWNLQESQLSEPLVSSRKTHSPQPGYYAYDKETGLESQPPPVPAQPLQRTRNTGLPPVSAQKYPGLFPAGASNQPQSQSPPVPQQDQIQVTPVLRQDGFSKPAAANEFQPGDDSNLRRNPSLSKEMGGSKFNRRSSTDGAAGSIRGDDISENSDVLGFEQVRCDSLQAAPRNPPAINGNQPHPQQPLQHFENMGVGEGQDQVGPLEEGKKKKPFHFGGTKKQSSFNVVGSDPSSTKNDPQPGKEHGLGSARKRLSELKSIKGIFNKNNGHDEDQLAKPDPQQVQAGRPSMSDVPPPQQGSQVPLWHQQPAGRAGQMGPGPGPGPSPLAGDNRPSMQGASRPPVAAMHPGVTQPVSNGDDGSRKPSGFLGFLNNRPGSKSHGHAALSGQPMPSQGQPSPPPGQQQFRQSGRDSPPFDPRMTGVGQVAAPQQQRSPPLGQGSPGFVTVPFQANQRPKMITVKSGQSGSPNRTRASTLPGQGGGANVQQPQRDVVATSRQGAVSPLHEASRDDRPSLPSQQNSFAPDRPDDRIWERPTEAANMAANMPANDISNDPRVPASPPLSRKSSEERISIGGASFAPRGTPTRKPVGSGTARDRAVSVSSANPSAAPTTAPTSKFQHVKSDSAVTVEPLEEHPALNDQPSLTHMGEKAGFGHGRQLSIPTPSVLSVAQTQSPTSQDAANRSSGHSQQQLSPKPSTGFSVQPPNVATDRQQQPVGPQRGGNNGSPGLAPPPNTHAQTWGPQDVSRPGTTQSSGPQQQQQNPQQMQSQMRTQTGPAQSQEPHKPEHSKSTMSKFFGGSKKQQAALQPSNSSAQSKDKERTKDKLKSVFKRSSKVPEGSQQQPQPQQLQQGQQQQMPMHMMQGGRGGPGQAMPIGMQRPPMGPNGSPQGSFPGPGQPGGPMPAGQGRGQMHPHMMAQMQTGRGQMFLPGQIPPQMLQQMQMQAGRGQQVPPHMMSGMMAGRGQPPPQQQQQQQPNVGGGRGQEPQYAQVPIPQGYQPVHGYGGTGAMAFSPYTYGQQFHQGYQPPMQQQFGPSPSNSPPSAQSPFGPGQPPFQGGMPSGMIQGHPQQQFAQGQGMPQGQPHHPGSHHTPTPPPQQPMMQGPPSQGQQPGGMVQSFAEGPRRVISPESSRDIAQGDASSRVSSMSPQNEGGLPKPNLQHIATTLDGSRVQGQQQQPNPHIQHPGSPQNYPLPDSAATFSPVNPAAGRLPNPPAPMAESMHDSEPATDKGNISDISHTPSPRSGMNGPGVAMTHNIPLADEQNRSSSLSPDPSRGPHHQVSNPALNINVGKANSQSSDTEDIYDATPRKMRSPSGQMHEPSDNRNNNAGVVGAAAAGGAIIGGTALGITAGVTPPDDMAHNGGGGYFVQPPNGGNYDASTGGTPSVAAESVTPYEHPGAQQLQQQQPAIHVEPEEKILVDQPVELAAAPDDLDDGMPVMSATSYPGQEWNPYGYGEFGDFEA